MAAGRPTLISSLFYRDPRAALVMLQKALGFELLMLIEDQDGNVVHSELGLDDSRIMVGGEWTEDWQSPASIGGKNTQFLHLHIETDVDEHCERARSAGMQIIAEPEDQFYGDRTYRCKDPEGHVWTVGQRVREVSREEAEAATGLKIQGWT